MPTKAVAYNADYDADGKKDLNSVQSIMAADGLILSYLTMPSLMFVLRNDVELEIYYYMNIDDTVYEDGTTLCQIQMISKEGAYQQ